MWIVNDITDCKTCLFYVSGLFVLLFQDSMREDVCICLRACVCV